MGELVVRPRPALLLLQLLLGLHGLLLPLAAWAALRTAAGLGCDGQKQQQEQAALAMVCMCLCRAGPSNHAPREPLTWKHARHANASYQPGGPCSGKKEGPSHAARVQASSQGGLYALLLDSLITAIFCEPACLMLGWVPLVARQ